MKVIANSLKVDVVFEAREPWENSLKRLSFDTQYRAIWSNRTTIFSHKYESRAVKPGTEFGRPILGC